MARNDVSVLTQETSTAIVLLAGNLHVLACLSLSWKDIVCRLKGTLIESFSAFDFDHSFVPTQRSLDNMNSCLARLCTYDHHCKRKTFWFEAQLRLHVVEHEFYCEAYSSKKQPKLKEHLGAMASSFRKLEARMLLQKRLRCVDDFAKICWEKLSMQCSYLRVCGNAGIRIIPPQRSRKKLVSLHEARLDEISELGPLKFFQIERCARAATNQLHWIMNGLKLQFSGDFMQLPPVRAGSFSVTTMEQRVLDEGVDESDA